MHLYNRDSQKSDIPVYCFVNHIIFAVDQWSQDFLKQSGVLF